MWTRADLKSKAKENLQGGYWALVVMALIMQILTGGGGGGGSSSSSTSDEEMSEAIDSISSSSEAMTVFLTVLGIVGVVVLVALIMGMLLSYFVYNPLIVGAQRYFITATYKDATFNDFNCLVYAFKKGNYMNVVKIMFLRALYTGLWSLLFIIPGIIKSYEYRMIPYILAEDPSLSTEEAFRLSKEMMDGNKFDTWVLELSFIGWHILSVFTCGLLSIFYVNPYMFLTYTQLYETLKHRASMDYYDHSIAGNGYAYSGSSANSYGNPGAYAQANPYADPYASQPSQSYATGELFNPSAPIEEETATVDPYSDPYKLPGDNE